MPIAYRWQVISVARIHVDAGQAFGSLPKRAWQQYCWLPQSTGKRTPHQLRVNRSNELVLQFNVLLLIAGERRILVGAGPPLVSEGPHGGAVTSNMVLRALVRHGGVRPREITDVVLVTNHYLFAGGAVHLDTAGDPKPSFPKATHYLAAARGEVNRPTSWALETPDLSAIPDEAMEMVDQEIEIVEGIRLTAYANCLPQHLMVTVQCGPEFLVYGGLYFPLPQMVAPTIIPAWAENPEGMYYDKVQLIREMTGHHATLVFPWSYNMLAGLVAESREGLQVRHRL